MKLLKVFGVVVGIHVFALILIFANPGCSSTSQPAPVAADTVAKAETPLPSITMPSTPPASSDSPMITVPGGFDPNAQAVSASSGVRYSPTRPGTPAAGALEAEPVPDVTPASTYTVGKGDSLWTIAKKNHLGVSELAAANNLKAGASVKLGQKIIIPGKSTSPVSAAAKTAEQGVAKAPAGANASHASADSVKHTVKPGETLGAIARKYQVKVGDLAIANNIADPAKIHPGMELVIPGWQAPATKTGRTGTTKTASAQAPVIPTISVSGDEPPPANADAPPTITVEEAPAKKR